MTTKQKQARRKDARKAKGLIIVNTGDGKGKTTAALGMVMRARGRDAPPEFIDYADLVSRIEKVKHPFDKGIRAQKGIEF